MSIIGGADGPTAFFITSNMGWINWFGFILLVLLFVPNVIWALRYRSEANKCTNKLMNLIEQIGRYGCMFLMAFNIGLAEFGFASPLSFIIYLIGNAVLLLAYWVFWIVYFKKQTLFSALILAILPTLIFLLCGVTLRHWLLVGFAVVFGVGHVYVTVRNAKM